MKKTPKGREVSFRARVESADPNRPIIWTADERLGGPRMIDQPSETSKSARNLARYYQRNGGPFEMTVRAYLQDGTNSIRLFGPGRKEHEMPPYRDDPNDGGYQGVGASRLHTGHSVVVPLQGVDPRLADLLLR
jgi:hypothetical protein